MDKVVKTAKIALAPLLIRDIIAMFIIIGFFWFFRDLLRYASNKIILYEGHIEGKTGLIKTHKLNSPLDKVTSVSVSSGFFGKIFGYGTISVTTAGSVVAFDGIKDANSLNVLINEQIEKASEAKMSKQARLMAEAMKQ